MGEYILIVREIHKKSNKIRIIARRSNKKTYVLEKVRKGRWPELIMDPIEEVEMELLAVIGKPNIVLKRLEDIKKLLEHYLKN